MDRIQPGEEMVGNSTKASDIDYNGAQNHTNPRPQTRGTAQLAAGVHLLPTGGIFKSAAVEVLRREQRLMATGEICKLALEWGLLKCSGKTPEATMASSLYGDIKRNDGASMFFRPSGGMFGLKEWIDQGLFPQWPPEGVPDALDRSQKASDRSQKASDRSQKGKKKRKNTNSSNLQPQLAAKRQHQAAPSPARAAVVLQNAAAERRQLEDQNTFETSWQQKPTNNSTNLINTIAPVTTTGTLTAEQPRERLPTSESNEAAGLSAATTAHNYYVPPRVNNNAAMPAELGLNQQDWIRSALAEQEIKVAAVENKWGPLHPRAGQAHLLLYKACKQQAIRFPSVESRALTALTRAYDIMMFNNQVEELGKLQGIW